MVDWIEEGSDYLAQDKEMVKKSFEVCGITSSDPERVRNGEFFKKCMEKAKESLDAGDDEADDDPESFNLQFTSKYIFLQIETSVYSRKIFRYALN